MYGASTNCGIPWGVQKPPKPFIEYILQTPAAAAVATTVLAKQQARVDSTMVIDDTYFDLLIADATQFCENYTKRDLINKTYIAYLDFFPYYSDEGIEIARSKLQSITSIQYYNTDGVLTTLDAGEYSFTKSNDFSSIYLTPTSSGWPDLQQGRRQAIQITFVAGYGAFSSSVPSNLIMGVLQHVTAMYQARGDAGDGGYDECLPKTSEKIYNQYRIFLAS